MNPECPAFMFDPIARQAWREQQHAGEEEPG
jgi:hypothetical protein